uniref:Solute carrier organic anion transporter family member n=1 Tax=Sinocyclocheilus rhinocerous TaxID=307959 RepID=A0A673IL61_9TELE
MYWISASRNCVKILATWGHIFIVALSFAYVSKTLCGTYMKSAITQIERRFYLSSSVVGLIDGSFEMGNLLFLAVVSHFGARLHRTRLIGMGCFLMAIGSAYPMVSKAYSNVHIQPSNNIGTGNYSTFKVPHCLIGFQEEELDPGSSLWIYVLLGNALRGIGETPVTPLGISYIDDFAKAENSAFYISCLQTIMLLGPMFGFLLGSMCAKLYVDIGFVSVVLAGVPFWFLPRSLPKQGKEGKDNSNVDQDNKEQPVLPNTHSVNLADIAKGFLPSLKKLMCTPAYFLLLCGIVLKFNSFIGLLTFKAKYMKQQFGQSASRANFLIRVLILPVVAVGIFLGGLLMKRYKLSVVAGAQLSFITSFTAFLLLLLLLHFGTKCDNVPVAGLTVSYNGTPGTSQDERSLMSQCNQNCSCSTSEWDPVCSDSGITYVSPCLAGCTTSTGQGKNTVFHNCSCVLTPSPAEGSRSVSLGQCPHGPGCTRSFTSYMAVSVLNAFSDLKDERYLLYITYVFRCITPELKSLAFHKLGGIPAPVYFGALIDSTYLKWGIKSCGGRGACRMYDSNMYRLIFLSLTTCLSGCSYFFIIAVIVLLRKQFRKEEVKALQQTASKQNETELQSPEMCHPDGSKTDTGPREKTESTNTEC